MTHCSDDDLVLHYYGESPEADAHVAGCASCAARARELSELLSSVSDDAPERGERYGTEVWYRVRPQLERRRPFFGVGVLRPATVRWSLAAAATVALIAAGFVAGRLSMPGTARTEAPAQVQSIDAPDPHLGRRVLLLSVADHLERSERVLTDIMNTPAGELAPEQQWARDLIAANRLFRQDAVDADEASVATVLDELERALLDIVHRPADAHADLDQIRRRIDSAALLFKVRVMSDELRQRELGADDSSADRSITPIS